MNPSKRLTLWNVECTYTETQDGLLVSPVNSKDYIKLLASQMVSKEPFSLSYGSRSQHHAFISHTIAEGEMGVRLVASHIFRNVYLDSFDQMYITGEIIDDYFSPSSYFYERATKNESMPSDLLYNHIVADEWSITFKNKPLLIRLQYGDILADGIASDLVLHPKLVISFEQTVDFDCVLQIFNFVIRFFQFIHYAQYIGNIKASLSTTIDAGRCENGFLLLPDKGHQKYDKVYHGLNYTNSKPYIHPLLQFFANHSSLYTRYIPEYRKNNPGESYTQLEFLNIFYAFEAECHANESVYEMSDNTHILHIQQNLLTLIDEIPQNEMNADEKKFLSDAKSRLIDLGTRYGLKSKVINAFHVLENCINSSIEKIFSLPNFTKCSPLSPEDIAKFAKFVVSKRSSLAHGNPTKPFTASDMQYIHLLEIMVYCQILRRAELPDAAIERIIGAVFWCNTILYRETFQLPLGE